MNIQLGRNGKARAEAGLQPLLMLSNLFFDFVRCEATDTREEVSALLGLVHDKEPSL